jgi:hypothetical protein
VIEKCRSKKAKRLKNGRDERGRAVHGQRLIHTAAHELNGPFSVLALTKA